MQNEQRSLREIVIADISAGASGYFSNIKGPNSDVDADTFVDEFLSRFVSIDLLQVSLNEHNTYDIVKVGKFGTVYSQKLANLIINWKDIVSALPSIASTAYGSAEFLNSRILAAIVIFTQFSELAKIPLTELHVAVIRNLLLLTDNGTRSVEEAILLKKMVDAQLDETTIVAAIVQLSNFGVIKVFEGQIVICETIQIAT